MAAYFFDSSALVKRYRREAGSGEVRELVDGAESVFISRLAHVEVSAAIVRRSRSAGVRFEDVNQAIDMLDSDMGDSFDVVELDVAVLQRAVELTRKHGLRAADAIQLASAIFARESNPSVGLTFVGSDEELNIAAAAEGLSILDPSQ